MGLMEKKEILYSVKGNQTEWKKLKKALKDAGIRGVSSDVWLDEAPVCGCGAHLAVRDFGPNGKIDRSIYTLRVPVSEMEDALLILHALCPDYTPYQRDPNRKSLY